MAEKYLFFNSTIEDRRKHKASDIAEYWDSFISSGLIHENGIPNLKVSANGEDMKIIVDAGKSVILGHLYINNSPLIKTIKQSTASEDRFDRVVLRLDTSIENRYIKIFIKEGTETEPPELERIGDIYELSLAQIHIKKGKSFLENIDIIDERFDESLCGLASSLITVPTDELMREWHEWFDALKDETYATNKDVRGITQGIKREVANLNLQLEAGQRVPQGVTYGHDFKNDVGFGMQIDTAKTFTRNAISPGDTDITADSIEGFVIGQEVTIYDGINVERKKIIGITEDFLEFTPFTKQFKANANIARSMIFRDVANEVGRFGPWGTLEYKNKSFDVAGNRLLDACFILNDGNFYTMESIAGKYTLISNDGDVEHRYEKNKHQDRVILSINKIDDTKLVVFSRQGTNYYVQVVGYELENISPEIAFANSSTNQYTGAYTVYKVSDDEIVAFVTSGGNVSVFVFKLTIDTIERTGNHLVPADLTQSSSARSAVDYTYRGGIIYVASVGATLKVSSISLDQIVGNQWESKDVLTSIPYGGTAVKNIHISTDSTGDIYTYASITHTGFKGIYATHGGSVAGLLDAVKILDYPNSGDTLSFKGNMDLNDHLFLMVSDNQNGIDVYKKQDDGLNLDYVQNITKTNHITRGTLNYDGRYLIPPIIYTTVAGTNHKVVADFEHGAGANLIFNDIRFSFNRPASENATWITGKGLEVTSAKFGTVEMDIVNTENESQMTALSPSDANGILITMVRETTETDVEITKILGGIN